MLCAKQKTDFFPAFRNENNFYRGRFHRVITIGSPHNGSLLLYYALKIYELGGPYFQFIKENFHDMNLLQPKFNPFGSQIEQINSYTVDQGAKFHLIRSRIDGCRAYSIYGHPISIPALYWQAGLCSALAGTTRADRVIPFGSDGVVDFYSQSAGCVANVTTVYNLSHSSAERTAYKWKVKLDDYITFGVGINDCETRSRNVATLVKDLLNGPETSFGPFVMPTKVSFDVAESIFVAIPVIEESDNVRNVPPGFRVAMGVKASAANATTTFTFVLDSGVTEPIDGAVVWLAKVFGTNGLSTVGVTVDVDTNDFRNVSVSVDNDVVGDVVLSAMYVSSNGNIVISKPTVVMSAPVGASLTNIEIVPVGNILSLSNALETEIWGSFDNGVRRLLYVPPDAPGTYSSSNPGVLSVDTNGVISAVGLGVGTVTVTRGTNSAQTSFNVLPATGQPFWDSAKRQQTGDLEFNLIGRPWNYYQIYSSTNFVDWLYWGYSYSSNGVKLITEPASSLGPRKFYHAIGN